MTIFEQYKLGKITLDELKKKAAATPELAAELKTMLQGEVLSDENLEEIAGGSGDPSFEEDLDSTIIFH